MQVAGRPILLVRDLEDRIRAFHNVCLHRGAQLVDAPCRDLHSLQCPNHRWSYRLDGRLQGRPHFFGGDKHDTPTPTTAPRLHPVRTALWHDLIFVNLDGEAAPFEEFIRPVEARIRGYDMQALRYAGTLTFEVNCNWKLIQENFIEPYHVFAVHPRLIEFGPMRNRRPSEFEGACIFNDYEFPEPQQGRGSGLPYFPNLDERGSRLAIWFHLFPSISFEIFPDQFALVELTPLGPERTRERLHIYLVGDAADSDRFAAQRQAVFDTWRDLNHEDITIVERMQRGRHSPGFDGGTLSPYWDGAVRHFARLMVAALR